jgi:hypothetical protein
MINDKTLVTTKLEAHHGKFISIGSKCFVFSLKDLLEFAPIG